jgi:hypothetical protein
LPVSRAGPLSEGLAWLLPLRSLPLPPVGIPLLMLPLLMLPLRPLAMPLVGIPLLALPLPMLSLRPLAMPAVSVAARRLPLSPLTMPAVGMPLRLTPLRPLTLPPVSMPPRLGWGEGPTILLTGKRLIPPGQGVRWTQSQDQTHPQDNAQPSVQVHSFILRKQFCTSGFVELEEGEMEKVKEFFKNLQKSWWDAAAVHLTLALKAGSKPRISAAEERIAEEDQIIC